MYTEYYDLLGVNQQADETTIKNAYRKLAMKYHPDRNAGDSNAEARFKEINTAYETLKDPTKRSIYDRYGPDGVDQSNAGGFANGFSASWGGTVSDIFESFFDLGGGQSRSRRRERGNDLRYDLEISLEESFTGKKLELEIPSAVACSSCGGSGAKSDSDKNRCSHCHGRGQINSGQGIFVLLQTCSACQGKGFVITNPCSDCRGQGQIEEERTINVNVPKGIENGTRIRVPGGGEPGPHGSQAGDLYVFVSLAKHSIFNRDGADLYCTIPMPITDAALGTDFEFPTISGKKAKVTIPECTQTDQTFRLKGKGMPVLESSHFGDLYVRVKVEIPEKLTKRQKELLQEFKDESDKNNYPQSHGYFAKIKDFIKSFGN